MDHDFDKYFLIPQYSELTSRKEIDVKTKLTDNIEISHPIISSPMNTVTELDMALAMAKTGSLGILHRYLTIAEQVSLVSKLRVLIHPIGVSIGVNGDSYKRASALINAEADVLTFDVAHGDMKVCYDFVKKIKKEYGDVDMVSGNIVTVEAAERYYSAGIDAFRVGIGIGGGCISRIVCGVGYNQILAIKEIKEKFPEIPIISDGGIRNSGDLVKVLASGADCTLIGSLLAATKESPAERITINNEKFVKYFGMASKEAETLRIKRTNENELSIDHLVSPEGKVKYIPDNNQTVEEIIRTLIGGLKHGMAYIGATTIPELLRKAVWTTQ